MEHSFIDKYAGLDSIIHRANPGAKLLFSLLFAVSAVLVELPNSEYLLFHSLTVMILIILSRVPLLFVLKRALLVVPFVTFPALAMYLSNSNHDWLLLSTTVLKGMLSAAIFIILVSTTRFTALLDVLRTARIPRPIISTLSFMYRYVFIIMDQGMRMQRAREMRYFGGFYRRQAGVYAGMISTLFIRAYERGERVYNAMLMRGFDEQRRK